MALLPRCSPPHQSRMHVSDSTRLCSTHFRSFAAAAALADNTIKKRLFRSLELCHPILLSTAVREPSARRLFPNAKTIIIKRNKKQSRGERITQQSSCCVCVCVLACVRACVGGRKSGRMNEWMNESKFEVKLGGGGGGENVTGARDCNYGNGAETCPNKRRWWPTVAVAVAGVDWLAPFVVVVIVVCVSLVCFCLFFWIASVTAALPCFIY